MGILTVYILMNTWGYYFKMIWVLTSYFPTKLGWGGKPPSLLTLASSKSKSYRINPVNKKHEKTDALWQGRGNTLSVLITIIKTPKPWNSSINHLKGMIYVNIYKHM